MRFRLLIVLLLAVSWAASDGALAQESTTATAAETPDDTTTTTVEETPTTVATAETTTTTTTLPPLPYPAVALGSVGDTELDICNGVEVRVPVTSLAPVGLTIDWAGLDLIPFDGLSSDPPGTAFGTSLAGGRVEIAVGNSDNVLDPGETWILVYQFNGLCSPAYAPPPYAIVAAAGGVVAGEDTQWCVGGAGYCPGATDPIVPIGTATDVILTTPTTTLPVVEGYGSFGAWARPTVLTPRGGYVTFWINPHAPRWLPVTITDVTSSLHGDVTDPANPEVEWTTCSVPVDWQPDMAFGWAIGWGCTYNAWIDGTDDEIVNTFSVAFTWGVDTKVVHSEPAVITVNDELGAIHGTVVDELTGAPIPGLLILGDSSPGCYTMTDAQGRFLCAAVEPGEYYFWTGNNSQTPSDYAPEWYDDAATAESATPIAVSAGEITTIEWGLSIGGVIEGTVTNETTGEPIPGIRVEAPGIDVQHETDANGFYRVTGLATGDYLVCFMPPNNWDLQECWDDHPNGNRNWPNLTGDLIHIELGEVIAGIDAAIALPVPTDANGTDSTGGGDGNGNGETLPHTGITTIDGIGTGLLLAAIGLVLLALPRTSRRSVKRRQRTLGR